MEDGLLLDLIKNTIVADLLKRNVLAAMAFVVLQMDKIAKHACFLM